MALTVLYALSYLLGSVPFGYLVAKSRGVDITKVGSGNTGATNVYRTLGKGAGLVVFVLDVLKGYVPVVATRLLLEQDPSLGHFDVHGVFAGLAAVLGHSFSPFLRFKGGKGVATGLGVLAGAAPVVAAFGLGTFVLVLWVTRIVSASSIAACLAVILTLVVSRQPTTVTVVFGLVACFVVIRHAPNIKRLIRGEEPKITSRPYPPEDHA